MKYDLSNFYNDLKLKFNKSNGKETLLFLMEEFSKTISLKDERAIIAVGNELASFLRVKGQTDFAYKIYKVIKKLVLDSYGFISKDYASLLINISNCHIVAKNYDLAIDNLNETENILSQLSDTKYLMPSVYNDETVGEGPIKDILIKNLNQAKKQREIS